MKMNTRLLVIPNNKKTKSLGCNHNFRKCTCGVSAVEFAILAPVMLIFVYGILNFGIYYYYTSIVENSLFALSRSVIDPAKRPADLTAAQAMFNSSMTTFNTADLGDKQVVLLVEPLTATSPASTTNPVSGYNVISGQPAIIRVVYPRPDLISVDYLVAAWPKIFGNKIDISIMIDVK